jgi:DNA-binding NarL/FixJ family response regulator
MARVLLADSQPLFNEALEALFSRDDAHHVVGRCSSADDAFAHVSSLRPDLVLVDAALGLEGSPNLVTRMLEACPETRVIVLGDDHDAELLLAAIRAGAAGVVGKTYGASTVLRVAGAVMQGEGAVPRGMLLELARRMVSRDRAPDSPLSRLSPRERQVLALLSRGWDNARIGRDLFISQHTVRTHIQNILEKLGMHSKLEAATFAMQRSMELELPPAVRATDRQDETTRRSSNCDDQRADVDRPSGTAARRPAPRRRRDERACVQPASLPAADRGRGGRPARPGHRRLQPADRLPRGQGARVGHRVDAPARRHPVADPGVPRHPRRGPDRRRPPGPADRAGRAAGCARGRRVERDRDAEASLSTATDPSKRVAGCWAPRPTAGQTWSAP